MGMKIRIMRKIRLASVAGPACGAKWVAARLEVEPHLA